MGDTVSSLQDERDFSIALANRILDRPSGDPDDDLAVLSRQLLRKTGALIAANTRIAELEETITSRESMLDRLNASNDNQLRRIDELEQEARDAANRNVARMGEFEHLLGADKQRIDELEAQLRELQWKPITPDSLPKVGDEVWIADSFFKPGIISIVTEPDFPYSYWRSTGTHYLPISPPRIEREGEKP